MHCFFRFIFGEIVSGWKRVFFEGRRPFFLDPCKVRTKKTGKFPGFLFISLRNCLHFQSDTQVNIGNAITDFQ